MNHTKKAHNLEHTRQLSRKNIINPNQKTNNPLSNKKNKKSATKKNNKSSSEAFIISESNKNKIPRLINQLERNVQQLKRYCIDTGDNMHKKKKSLSTMRSQTKLPVQNSRSGVTQQIQDIRKSYASIYGKDTSNLVELYNFYKKGIEKSTGILGSISKKAQSMSMSRNNNMLLSREESIFKSKTPSIITQSQQNFQESCKQTIRIEELKENIFIKNRQKIESDSNKKQNIDNSNNQNNQNINNIPEQKQNKFHESVNVAHIISEKRNSLPEKPKIVNYRFLQMANNQAVNSNSKSSRTQSQNLQALQHFQEQNKLPQNQNRTKFDKRKSILQKFTFINSPFDAVFDKRKKTPQKCIQKEQQILGSKEKSNKNSKSKNKQSNTHSNKKKSNVSSQKNSSNKTKQLNQAQIFEQIDKQLIKPTKKSEKSFEKSKYYVQPIKKFKQDANNSLFDCSISIRDDGLNCRNVDLDFIPLDL